MSLYREHRFWSPLLGCEAARLSAVGGTPAARFHGEGARTSEYFAITRADVKGREYRLRRIAVLDAVNEAIERGDRPGEVTIAEADVAERIAELKRERAR